MNLTRLVLTALFLGLSVHPVTAETLLNGTQKEYYENGQVRSETSYKDGKPHGYAREYYQNGNLAFSQRMSDGNINGRVQAYYENGRLKGEVRYVNNREEGVSKEYYENGKVKEEALYIEGQMVNLKKFDENGHLLFNQSGKFDQGCAVIN